MDRINEKMFRQRIDKLVTEAYWDHMDSFREKQRIGRQQELEKKIQLIDALSDAIIRIYGDIPVNKRVLNFAIDPIIKQIHSWERDNRFR